MMDFQIVWPRFSLASTRGLWVGEIAAAHGGALKVGDKAVAAPASAPFISAHIVLALTFAFVSVMMAIAIMTPAEAASIEIRGDDHPPHRFDAEIVKTAEDKARGLMFRDHLDRDAAMLFGFDPPGHVRFWMRNTLIPLDMIFVDAHGQIIHIETRWDTQSDRATSVDAPVAWVVEINAGEAERRQIKIGDHMHVQGEE